MIITIWYMKRRSPRQKGPGYGILCGMKRAFRRQGREVYHRKLSCLVASSSREHEGCHAFLTEW